MFVGSLTPPPGEVVSYDLGVMVDILGLIVIDGMSSPPSSAASPLEARVVSLLSVPLLIVAVLAKDGPPISASASNIFFRRSS